VNDKELRVKMLGNFSLSYQGKTMDDSSDRSRKVWLLLGYLLYNHARTVSAEELVELLSRKEGANPAGALKTTLHRARNAMDALFTNAGHEFILNKNGGYFWSPDYSISLDIVDFERLYFEAEAETDKERKLQLWMEAEKLFEGDFLKKLSSEIWVVPVSAYYHRLYLEIVSGILSQLEEKGLYEELCTVAKKAVVFEPSREEFSQYLMKAQLQLGMQKNAAETYENLRALLLNDYGVMPSEETRLIYRKVLRIINSNSLQLDAIKLQLTEKNSAPGAMMCEYDFFRALYQAEARAIARNGNAVHIALLSVLDKEGEELAQRSLDRVMNNLQEQIRINLRKGDIASRCSVSQFIIMLPQANYENSCMVCRRIISAFSRQYPHSPARIDYVVEAMQPNI